MTLIETIAKALHVAHYEAGRGIAPPWPSNRFKQEHWYFQARAALAAAREPTEAMCASGSGAVSTLFDPGAKAVWQAMIAAALGEEATGGKA